MVERKTRRTLRTPDELREQAAAYKELAARLEELAAAMPAKGVLVDGYRLFDRSVHDGWRYLKQVASASESSRYEPIRSASRESGNS